MSNSDEKLLVIGAGPSGLAMAKALKEAGIAYEQIEADDGVGGNWYHGVYETAHIISSKKTTEYADFPMPADYPDFPSRRQMADYYKLYADTFGLWENIQFKTKVVMCRPLENEKWEVELADGEKRIYKGVVVCSGHHWHRRFPDYQGTFTGEFIHSKDYRSPEQLARKKVLVIGGGNSACDIVSEAARVAVEAHLSLRRGYWFLPKTLFGKPAVESAVLYLPVSIQRLILKVFLKIVVGKYEDYGLPYPDHKIFERHPTINSELLHYLKHGKIKPNPDVERFEEKTVHFVDKTNADFDMIVCGTGFYVSFPFLPEGLVPIKNGNLAMLYAGCVLADYKNLYIVGTQQVRYGVGPLLTPASKLIAKMIRLQDEMGLPIGLVLKETGAKLPTSHLVDPISALYRMKIADWTMPLLLRKERKLRRRFKGKNFKLPKLETSLAKSDMQVY